MFTGNMRDFSHLLTDYEYNNKGGMDMLAAENMLQSLMTEEKKNHKNSNDDRDFGKVLEFCGSDSVSEHKIRYSDGEEKFFSFDN